MSQDSEESWRNIPNCIGTVYDPNPLADGWIVRHGPDIPALNELKNKLIVNTPPTEPERTARVLPANVNLTRRPDISQNIAKPQAAVSPRPTSKRRVLPQLKKHTVASRGYSSFSSLINPIMEANRLYMNLNQQQKEIHKAVLSEKKNVFIIGSAGSGKSALLKSIISSLKTENNHDHIAITSATSAAAMNVRGSTLNSFASIDIPDQPVDYYISKIRKNLTKLEYLKEVRVLIIDRISAVDVDVFKKANYICRKIRRDERPFGGIQVILCGDSDLLPPGTRKETFESEICQDVIEEGFVLDSTF